MKDLFLVLILTVAAATAALAQGPTIVKPTAVDNPVAAAMKENFPREKFDVKHDPRPDLDGAIAAAAKTGKRIILDIGGEWCSWCVYMDKFFLLNPALAKLRDDNYIWVKVNFSEENENPVFLKPYPAATGYPHLYVLDETGKLIKSQDTSELEAGKGYNLEKFSAFLKAWAPPNTTSH